MDVQRLRVLRELADRGSVTAVAAALSFTPSAISQQLKALSEEVGMPLTEPAGRGLRLTEAGRALVGEAEHVLAAVARAEAAVQSLREAPQGVVRMALFPSGARMLLAGLLRHVAGSGIELQVRDLDMQPSDAVVLAADHDLVVTHRDEHTPPLESRRHRVLPLVREPLDVVLPPGHPLAAQRRIRLDELADEPWISVNVGWPVDDVLRSLTTLTGTRPRIVQRINDFSVTEELVAAGVGVALLPRWSTDDRRGRRFVRRPLAGVRAARMIEIVLRESEAERPAVRSVITALEAAVRDVTGS
ncbi:LysR family transcriptional regulator [Pseudonocardia ailaonensis]|uniref:LysR family transcriptional regulator n=1 Tax=Pseudonocardia ailaonensis TaxID=367279 RepID=A0ABN2MPS4_9PSEU